MLGKNTMFYAIIGILVVGGVLAFATNEPYKQDIVTCQNFCALNNLEYAFVSDDQDCSCYINQMYADVDQDAFVQWRTVVNAGKILNLSVTQPMTDQQKQLIQQEIERRQLLQQQLQAQGGQ